MRAFFFERFTWHGVEHYMNTHIEKFESLGFQVEETGGGCQWMRKPLNAQTALVITDGEAALPDEYDAQLYVQIGDQVLPVDMGGIHTTSQLYDFLWSSGLNA